MLYKYSKEALNVYLSSRTDQHFNKVSDTYQQYQLKRF